MTNLFRYGLFFLSVFLVCLVLLFSYPHIEKQLLLSLDRTTVKSIEREKVVINNLFDRISGLANDSLTGMSNIIGVVAEMIPLQDPSISVFLFKGQDPIFWTTDQVPLDINQCNETYPGFKELTLSNGRYLVTSYHAGNFHVAGCILLSTRYPFENKFLINGTSCEQTWMNIIKYAPVVIFLTGYIFLLLFLVTLWLRIRQSSIPGWIADLIFVLDVLLIRTIVFFIRFPDVVYSAPLFHPSVYSSCRMMPSLGDLLLHVITLIFITLVLVHTFRRFSAQWIDSDKHGGSWSLFFLLLFSAFMILNQIWIFDITYNSSFSLDLSEFQKLDAFSIAGFAALLGILTINVVTCSAVMETILKRGGISRISRMGKFFLIIFALSLITTAVMQLAQNRKEREVRSMLADKLLIRQNPLTEETLMKIIPAIENDSLINEWLNFLSKSQELGEDTLRDYLFRRYLNSLLPRYDIQVTACYPSKILNIQPNNLDIACLEYFADLVEHAGEETDAGNIWLMDYGAGSENYLAIISPVFSDNLPHAPVTRIYLELSSKSGLISRGYPALLMDEKRSDIPDVSEYFFAIYRKGKLQQSFGTYNFPILNTYQVPGSDTGFYRTERGIEFYYLFTDQGTALVLGKPEDSFINLLSRFSYLLLLLILMIPVFFWVEGIRIKRPWFNHSLKYRLQITMIGALMVTIFLVGFFSVFYIITLNEQKNDRNLKERTLSLIVELQHKLSGYDDLVNTDPATLENMLLKFSNVFFTDINLYDPRGILLASSRRQIFDQGLISALMNPLALKMLKQDNSSLYIQKESIGRQKYSSAYMPLFNARDNLLGFMSVPYFSRQDELTREISGYLVAFVNIYVLIFLAGIAISILISRRIARPLGILKQRLSEIKLGHKNEIILWQHNDEIGHIVEEYNKMVDVLAENTERLARSERESAWREMARQVAHDIKNPLTPMKLSIQHLKKAWEENATDWELRLDRFTRSMMIQVDQLSSIASDFSDFAKMPEPEIMEIDLRRFVKESTGIFMNIPQVNLSITVPEQPCYINADPKHLNRIINNLINNSLQSFGPNQKGNIIIDIRSAESYYEMDITDDGEGIEDEYISKVFQPYFTTRSGGSGLGLAIVKGLLQTMNGNIEVISVKGVGTQMKIVFPKSGRNEK